jgi:hypothetical protein
MKVCLLLSGQLRNAVEIFPYFEKNLLSLYDVDVFISSWRNTSQIDSSNNFNVVPYDDSLSEVVRLYNPASIELESYDYNYNNIWVDMVNPFKSKIETNTNLVSMCSMFYKMMKSNEVKNNFKKINNIHYDLVIQTRMDIKLEEELKLSLPNKNTLYIPKGWDWSGGLNNLLAYGDEDTMNQYCNLFNHYTNILTGMDLINSEKVTKQYIETKTNLTIDRPAVDLTLRNMNIKETYWFN